MTIDEFNERWKDYLESGHYGLDIDIPTVIEYLDSEFENKLTKLPGFTYSQIKLKFGQARFYFHCDEFDWSVSSEIESNINKLVKDYKV